LVVDDHFLFAQAIATTIKLLDEHDVVGIAVTGPQALALTKDEQPDVILLDYHMPGYLAEDLLPRLVNAAPRTRVVIVTSDTSDAARERGLAAGASGFITKDKAIDDVVDALRATTRLSDADRAVREASADVAEPAPAAEAVAAQPAVAEAIVVTPEEDLPAPEEPAAVSSPAPRPEPDPGILVRLRSVSSFADLAAAERKMERLAPIAAIHAREMDSDGAVYRVDLRDGWSISTLAVAAAQTGLAIEVVR